MSERYVTLDGERIDGENVVSFGQRGDFGFVCHRITAGDSFEQRQLRAVRLSLPFESSATIDDRGYTLTVTEYGDVRAYGYTAQRAHARWLNV